MKAGTQAHRHNHGDPPRPSDAIAIESKGISNRSNRTLAEIFAKKQKNRMATLWRCKPNVLGFVRIGIRFEQME